MYDLMIVGAGPGGIFTAYEAIRLNPDLKIGVFETGSPLEKENVRLMEKRSSLASIVKHVPS